MARISPAALLALAPALLAEAPLPVRVTALGRVRNEALSLEAVVGELRLPARMKGAHLRPAAGEKGLESPLLVPPRELFALEAGETPKHRPEDLVAFQVVGLRRGGARAARLELWEGERRLGSLDFAFSDKALADPKPLVTCLQSRAFAWAGDGPLAEGLWASAASAYKKAGVAFGLDREQVRRYWRPGDGRFGALREGGGAPSLLGLLGGRAAVDETLQLDRALAEAKGGEEVPLANLEGIQTPSHPWAEMRRGRPEPRRLPLADCVPLDRPLLYLHRPAAALASLEGGGAAFLGRVSSFMGEGRMDTAVVARTMEDLGLGTGMGRRLLAAGAVREAALFSSDLSFLAGTEVTLVAELAPLASALLPLPDAGIQPRGAGFWARRGDRLFMSTSKEELGRALALHDAQGAGSLGRSDEFAVVLGALAPDADTEAFAYLSDGFIRGLVGPRQRILQMRLALARRRMEGVVAAALLRRMDAPGEPVDLARLKALGYLPAELDLEGISLGADGRVSHQDFGPLERLRPLDRVPLGGVSSAEAAVYESFRQGYQDYWRRYFDPIAFRLDAAPDGRMSLETFVLPLLDNSLYKGLKGVVAEGERPRPRWAVPMVAELGLKVAPEALSSWGRLGHSFGASPELGETFTGAVAVAFPDSAPVIQVGNGSVASLFDAGLMDRQSDLLSLAALALGGLTRPLAVALELRHPEAFATELRTGYWDRTLLPYGLLRDLDRHVAQEPDGRVLLRLGFFGLASLRLTAHVEGRWLVLSNDASLPSPLVAGDDAATGFPAGVRLDPSALKLGLPAAYQAATEGEAKGVRIAGEWLAPWVQAGLTPEAARTESLRLLGTAPLVQAGDLGVTGAPGRFGNLWRPTLPPFDPKGRFGLLEGVSSAEVEMRFEGDGMRARVAWRP